jgi:hypothetical protein
MGMHFQKDNSIALYIAYSILAHFFVLSFVDVIKPFEWTRPIVVTLVEPGEMSGRKPAQGQTGRMRPAFSPMKGGAGTLEDLRNENKAGVEEEKEESVESTPATYYLPAKQKSVEPPEDDQMNQARSDFSATHQAENVTPDVASSLPTSVGKVLPRQIRSASPFITAKREKLTYRIVMYGLSVGDAVLEAVSEGNELRISSAVSSNSIISSFYPVSDYAESRHIAGRYIISRVRQQEGNFTSDTGFTIALPEKNIFWIDRKQNSFANHPLPREDVMDVLSGLYYLRNQQLEVGKTVVLHLFDSNRYAETNVEVLRREHVSLPGFRDVDALVIHPLIKTDCIFRRAGDMLIWLSDDENRVPVILETSVPLGRVRAELVSAEGERD